MLSDGLCVWWCACFLILVNDSIKEVYGNPSTDFSKHIIVKPKLQHGRTKRDITSTEHSTGLHHPEVTLTVSIEGEEYELDLRLNEALVPSGHSLSYQQAGRTRVLAPGKEELDICQYSGRVRGRPGSWAAVSTCRGVRGVLYDGHQLRYIEPVDGNEINADHFLYSHEHLVREYRCGNPDGTTHSSNYSGESRYKRNAEITNVRTPASSNQRTRYVELVLVVDHSEFLASGGDLSIVHHQMKDLANIINSVYAPLNIFIALVGVEVWTEKDKISIVKSADETHKNFCQYRSTELLKTIPNDNAHLLTQTRFNDDIVGRASISTMCSTTMSAGVVSNDSNVVGLLAMTLAHEMGHNFGMKHDEDYAYCKCADKKFIMSSTITSVIPERWSSCSLQSLSLSFEKGLDHCLRNVPKKLFQLLKCGNGILEEGEQCDCGITPGVSPGPSCHSCCNPDCTLRANATCGHGQCCDLTTCRPKAIGTECRTANHECDLPEFCNGTSPFCPHDVFKMDATPCGNGKAYCARGSCRSHTDQCRLLWGVTGARSDDVCYDYNSQAHWTGNCGYDRVAGRYLPCAKEDVFCGRLQCSHLSKELKYSSSETAVRGVNWLTINGMIFPCHVVAIDLDTSDGDPGLVPDGAKCGPNKMCMQQRCLSVEQVRAMVKPEGAVCSSNCSGHGVCNSNGNCHCEPGYAPPLCALPGAGGSYDSGPIVDTSGLWRFKVAMYVIFLGFVPGIVVVLLLIYCNRRHGLCWKQPNEHHCENTSKPWFSSKLALPNFNSFGNRLKFDNKVITRNNNGVRGQGMPVRANTKPAVMEERDVANIKVAPAPPIKNNNTNVTEPMSLNSRIKEDVVMIENCLYYAPIHKNPANNLDVQFKPKIDAIRNKFELSEQKSYLISPNFRHKDLNKEPVLKENHIGSHINRSKLSSTIMPKPNLNAKPSVCPKPTVSPQLDANWKSDAGVSTKLSFDGLNAKLGFRPNPGISESPKLGGNPKPGVTHINRPKLSSTIKPTVSPQLDTSSKSNACVSTKLSFNAKLGFRPNPGISESPKLGGNPKPGVTVSPDPGVNPKLNRLPRGNKPRPEIIKVGLVSTTNEHLNYRSKLRKIGDIKDEN